MKDSFRNSLRMTIMSMWRRKYLLVSGCLVWAVFYLYLHYSTVPEEVGYTADGTSVKHPIDVNFIEHTAKLVTKATKPLKIDNKNLNKDNPPPVQTITSGSIPESHYKGMTEEEIRIHRMNEELEKKKHSQKSIREKYMEQGIKPTSVLMKAKYKSMRTEIPNITTTEKPPLYIPPLRLVHFDLKGAPPKITYFKSIFPLIRNAGANGILMEYEDTFPFWGPLSSIAASNAYTKKQIRYILELAKNNDLIIIPLVQTFGHLEFVLKLPEFKHLREVEDIPQSLCPTNNGSLNLVKIMIGQVMSLHTDSQWLHIGSDEVYQLGHCSRCSRYDRNSLFLAYVRKVSRYIRDTHKVTPIMWDDMLRHITVSELEKYEMGKLVEPMAWSYVEDVYLFLPNSLWEKYSQVFPFIWTASAFKGAFGETLTVPDAKRHLENNKAWLSVMSEQNSSFRGFRGIAITGWQRYDHFASLCELLPAAIPSLLLNVITVSQGEFTKEVFPRMQELLECSSRIHYHLDLEHDPNMWRALGVCFFPGSAVFRLTLRHNDVAKSLDKYINDITVHKGWMTEYNRNHNFSSPLRVNELLRDFSYYNSSLQMLQDAAVKALREIYEDDTVSEWIELNIYPFTKKMKEIWNHGLRLKKYQTWPRRPLPRIIDLPSPPNIDLSIMTS
ncbi:hexosaminidase D [Parasteatoda tepidariorum]|uniref:hexosaminidase D n=1 Tax=Parasteatoda tepidariorum TaxID=114398 RepID=UPI00077FD46E|nr:hexosaminidase D [Parasteatoda tepidariorum]XP_042903767.1 hexosaminidase D [Parasteatoda tepidariorum]